MNGQLTGEGGSARCQVKTDAGRLSYIKDVNPPLPEGDYKLTINSLPPFNVRHVKGEWVSAEEK